MIPKNRVFLESSGITYTLQANDGTDLSAKKISFASGASGTVASGAASGEISDYIISTDNVADIQAKLTASALFGGGVTFLATNAAGSGLTAITASNTSGILAKATTPTSFSAGGGPEVKGAYSFDIKNGFSSHGAEIKFSLGNGLSTDSKTEITLIATSGGTSTGTAAASGTFTIGKDERNV